jgi:hypothetical protein
MSKGIAMEQIPCRASSLTQWRNNLVHDSSEHIDTILWDLLGKVRSVIRDTDGRWVFRSKLYLSFPILYH